MKDFNQFMMMICSAISIWAFAGTKYKRLGFIAGLIGQPMWIYTTFEAGQWGMFLVSVWFSINPVRGLWNYRNSAIRKDPIYPFKGFAKNVSNMINSMKKESYSYTHSAVDHATSEGGIGYPEGYCTACGRFHLRHIACRPKERI